MNDHNQQEIKAGDTVLLNSGSPDLVVTGVKISVEWKDDDGETRKGEFPRECLTQMSTTIIHSESTGWDSAIMDSKKNIEKLKAAIRVFENNKKAGKPWPGDIAGETAATRN